ncbi:MAG: ABC transporter ATP-binding protein [Wenzhouxiangellaceae bacterium]|nr:ABC transporter ATP-binding protein [Wenzhouxiangellaceae bacterium]
MPGTLLEVENLTVEFATEAGPVRAVDGVSFTLDAGETLGIVGESGCGKSTTGLALMGLLPGNGRIAGGSIRLAGRELTGLGERAWRGLRGAELSMIFQEPMTALNPVYSVGRQITAVLRRHERLSDNAARERAIDMLARVGFPDPDTRLGEYPHELSGGMRQRVMVAMALACRPRLLIADEPTTALDVTTQAQVLEQIAGLAGATGTAVVLITHDLGVVAETCARVLVMYCGRAVEQAPAATLFATPRHRYTQGLLAAMPTLQPPRAGRLATIPGTVPEPGAYPPGCRFAPRCAHADELCRNREPAPERIGRTCAACFHPCRYPEDES